MSNRDKENIFTTSAYLLGFILCQDLDYVEQNRLGNYFMLIGQVLCTSSAYSFQNNNNIEKKDEDVFGMLNKVKNSIDKVEDMIK